jgi:hypothetical protein
MSSRLATSPLRCNTLGGFTRLLLQPLGVSAGTPDDTLRTTTQFSARNPHGTESGKQFAGRS